MTWVPRVAVFVSPHGFGHATRACAVLEALLADNPALRIELFTTVPRWLFEDSLGVSIGYHPVPCDVGLVQQSALSEDAIATVTALDQFFEAAPRQIERLAQTIETLGCQAVLCDIAPLGLAVAQRARRPGVLIENFLWSFIYEAYLESAPGLAPHLERFRAWEALASLRLAASPFCGETRSKSVAPVFRSARVGRAETRKRLRVSDQEQLVLWTMGGIPWDPSERGDWFDPATLPSGVVLVVPGASQTVERRPGLCLLPRHSSFYHPDLMAAADGVVGKLGYGTVVEAWASGAPLGFIPREHFPESPYLAEFALIELRGLPISMQDLNRECLGSTLGRLLERGRVVPTATPNGAAQAAAAIQPFLEVPGRRVLGSQRARVPS